MTGTVTPSGAGVPVAGAASGARTPRGAGAPRGAGTPRGAGDPRGAGAAPASGAGPLLLVTVFAAGCLVTFVRGPTAIRNPTLWAEDGAVWFHDAFTDGWSRPLWQPHAGYLQVFPRLIADAGLLVPLRWVPLVFVVVALAVQVMPAVLVVSRRFAHVVPDLRVRLLLAALYLVVPNSYEVDVNLTNAQWHLALLAVMVVLAMPARRAWRVFDVVVVVLSGLTGPFVLCQLVIVTVYWVCRRQRWTLVLASLSAATAALELLALGGSQRGSAYGPLGVTLQRLVDIVGGRVAADTVLGTATTTSPSFVAHLFVFSSIGLLLAAVVVALAVRRGPLELKLFNLYAGLVLAASLASPVITVTGSQWQVLTGGTGIRYWLFPSLALLADLVWLAGQFRTSWRWCGVAGTLLLVALVAFGVPEDFHYPTIVAPSWPAQVAHFEALPPGTSFAFQIRPRGWTMTLTRK